jgi:hypothetical protein
MMKRKVPALETYVKTAYDAFITNLRTFANYLINRRFKNLVVCTLSFTFYSYSATFPLTHPLTCPPLAHSLAPLTCPTHLPHSHTPITRSTHAPSFNLTLAFYSLSPYFQTYFQEMDDLLKTLPADDIQYQSSHSKQALSKLTTSIGASAVCLCENVGEEVERESERVSETRGRARGRARESKRESEM